MIHAGEKNIKNAWRKSLRQLYDEGGDDSERRYYRVSPAMIEVEDTTGEHFDDLYHFPVADISRGNRYLVTGAGEDGTEDDLSRTYRQRLFGASEEESSRIDDIVGYLRENPLGQNAHVSLWDDADMSAEDEAAPLVHSLSFRICDGALCLHVHMRASDGYRGLLPDMSRFATLQHYVAERIGVRPGQFRVFIDELHFKEDDREHVDLLLAP